jgi:hypothetical protein
MCARSLLNERQRVSQFHQKAVIVGIITELKKKQGNTFKLIHYNRMRHGYFLFCTVPQTINRLSTIGHTTLEHLLMKVLEVTGKSKYFKYVWEVPIQQTSMKMWQ